MKRDGWDTSHLNRRRVILLVGGAFVTTGCMDGAEENGVGGDGNETTPENDTDDGHSYELDEVREKVEGSR